MIYRFASKSQRPPSWRHLESISRLLAALVVSANSVLASGGPDIYGMTWSGSDDLGGPTFSWVDISALGDEIEGLLDDNTVGPFDLGQEFLYYWTPVHEIVIGSNGWVGFDLQSHFLPCFLMIPSPGGGADQLVAPFLSDLTFLGTGNPGRVRRWHDVAGQRYVVSFLEVPFWSGEAPGWVGSNTFQVILSAVDGSITFQYLDLDPTAFSIDPACPTSLQLGVENLTGNIGLQVVSNLVPEDGWAVRFDPPASPALSIADPGPSRVFNVGSRALFVDISEEFRVRAAVRNFGNLATVDDIVVTARILDENGALLDEQERPVGPLAALEERALEFDSIGGLTQGGHTVELSTIGGNDTNPGNNLAEAELRGIDSGQLPLMLDYTEDAENTGVFEAGGGAAMHIFPPSRASQILAVEVFPIETGADPPGFQVSIFDDDGPGGGPGTLLAVRTVSAGSFTSGQWSTVALDPAPALPCGGFYVTWQPTGAGLGIGTQDLGAASRRTLELANGAWRPFRDRDSHDFMIRVQVLPIDSLGDSVFCDGFEVGDTTAWDLTQ